MKEIYDTVSNLDMRSLFESEVESNQFDYPINNNNFIGLFKNLNLLNNIAQAQHENIKREREGKQHKKKRKSKRQNLWKDDVLICPILLSL